MFPSVICIQLLPVTHASSPSPGGVARKGMAEKLFSYSELKTNKSSTDAFLTATSPQLFPLALTLKWTGLTIDPREGRESCSNLRKVSEENRLSSVIGGDIPWIWIGKCSITCTCEFYMKITFLRVNQKTEISILIIFLKRFCCN